MENNMSPSKKKKNNNHDCVVVAVEQDSFSEEYDRCDEFGSSKYTLRNKGTCKF